MTNARLDLLVALKAGVKHEANLAMDRLGKWHLTDHNTHEHSRLEGQHNGYQHVIVMINFLIAATPEE